MRVYFWIGVSAIYLGFVLLLWEAIVEPLLLKRSLWLQVILIGLVFACCGLFSIEVVGAHAPISAYSYAMKNSNYSAGTVISGIVWDSHFTDLRVAITNPSPEDYEEVDISVTPDTWTNSAALVAEHSGCELLLVGGGGLIRHTKFNKPANTATVTTTRAGESVDTHDTAGNVYTTIATESGYRLRCPKLPAHFTVLILFSAVAFPLNGWKDKETHASPWGLKGIEVADNKSVFDLLGPRPSPSKVVLDGHYKRMLKTYFTKIDLAVHDGS